MLHFLAQPKRKITNNLIKKKKKQNCQKIKLHGRLTTKELKKHSSRLVHGAETGSQGSEDGKRRWLVDWDIPHSSSDKLGGTPGELDRAPNPWFQRRKLKSTSSGCKNLWVLQWQEKLLVTQEGPLEGPTRF